MEENEKVKGTGNHVDSENREDEKGTPKNKRAENMDQYWKELEKVLENIGMDDIWNDENEPREENDKKEEDPERERGRKRPRIDKEEREEQNMKGKKMARVNDMRTKIERFDREPKKDTRDNIK